MTTDTSQEGTDSPPLGGEQQSGQGEPGIFESMEALWQQAGLLVQEHLELASLESQRAGECLSSLMTYGFLYGGLVLSVWWALLAAIAIVLANYGVPIAFTMVGIAILNVLGILWCRRAIIRKSVNLRFPATLSSLKRTIAFDSSTVKE